MRPPVLLGLVLALAGCQSLTEAAREYVSERSSCPLDRVSARERTDKKPAQLRAERAPRPTPPADIAADPARLRLWQAKLDRDAQALIDLDRGALIEVTACDGTYLLDCYRKRRVANFNKTVACSEIGKEPLAR